MPGLIKISRAGLSFIKEQFTKNPSDSYAELLERYNKEAGNKKKA